MTLNGRYKNYYVKFGACFVIAMAIYFLYKAALPRLSFDDAYMFTRYAKNILINHNFGWNAGERTYGCTSIGYTFFIVLMEIISPNSLFSDEHILKLSSFFWGIMALIVIYKTLKLVINNTTLKKLYTAEFVLLILLFMPVFEYNLFNGMDTMMSMFGNSLMIFLFLKYKQKQTLLLLVLASLSAYFIFFCRPDNAICMIIFPVLFLWQTQHKLKFVLITYGIIGGCLIIDSLIKYLYFGYVLPLPFYVKSFGLYDGYLGISKWAVTIYLRDIFGPFIALIIIYIIFINRNAARQTLVFLIPMLITYGYFFTVVQVMGTASRYYIPFISFFIIGTVGGINNSFDPDFDFRELKLSGLKRRFWIIFLIFPAISVFGYFSNAYYNKLSSAAENEAKKYALSNVYSRGVSPDGVEWWPSIVAFDSLMKMLPANSVVAASEDGFIGSNNMNMKVMDLSQLHDNDMVKKIPLISSIEKIKPDIIWMPHSDYTKLRYEIFTSKKLIDEYDFYPQLLSYGIAIKKTYVGYNTVISYFDDLNKLKLQN